MRIYRNAIDIIFEDKLIILIQRIYFFNCTIILKLAIIISLLIM